MREAYAYLQDFSLSIFLNVSLDKQTTIRYNVNQD